MAILMAGFYGLIIYMHCVVSTNSSTTLTTNQTNILEIKIIERGVYVPYNVGKLFRGKYLFI